MVLLNSFGERCVVNLLIQRWVIATFSVDIMGQHILTVVDTANSWVRVGATIGMKRGFTKVCSEGRVGKPPRGVVDLRLALVHVLLVL